MVKTIKKVSIVLLSISLLTLAMAKFALNSNALEPSLPYDFGTWAGSGSVFISVMIDHTRFIKLIYDGNAVDPSNYTITGTDNITEITLKEEYLKTLVNGEYRFWADFSEKLEKFHLGLDWNGREFAIEGLDHTKFVKLTCDSKEVDPSNYSATLAKDSIMITLEEEYLETLTGKESFDIYFEMKDVAILYLNVDVQNTLPAVSTTSPAISSVDSQATTSLAVSPVGSQATTSPIISSVESQDYHTSPKTGDPGSIKVLLIIISLSAVVCFVALIKKKCAISN